MKNVCIKKKKYFSRDQNSRFILKNYMLATSAG